MSGDTEYCYPPSYTVLRNKLDIRDPAELDRIERRLVSARSADNLPVGRFDLDVPAFLRRKGNEPASGGE